MCIPSRNVRPLMDYCFISIPDSSIDQFYQRVMTAGSLFYNKYPLFCFCQNASQLRACRSSQPCARGRKAAWSELPPKNLEIRVTPAPGSTSVSSIHVVSPGAIVFSRSVPSSRRRWSLTYQSFV